MAMQGQHRQSQAEDEKHHREDRRRARQRIRGAAWREQPAKSGAAAAHAERTALGTLQKHTDHERNRGHELKDDEHGLHGWFGTRSLRPRS